MKKQYMPPSIMSPAKIINTRGKSNLLLSIQPYANIVLSVVYDVSYFLLRTISNTDKNMNS